ncbi:MAG TPA: glycosyltransferase family 9 protein [Patescibacteria group bacterium]|nr:glycosyltransferase family 9 protein [Patescibacteria group bacterium]
MLKKLEKRGKIALARLFSLFVRTRTLAPEELHAGEITRLLVIRQHNQMGDMLLAVPAFRGLRRRFPNARISLLAASINTDVMRNNPYIDEVLTYAKERHNKLPARLIRFVAQLRRSRFDAVIVLNTVSFSITSMLLAWMSGAAIRIGSTSRPFGHDLTRRFYHIELPLPSADELESMHESEHNLYPLSVLGVHERDLSSALVPSKEEERACDRFIAAIVPRGSRFAVVHPGAGKKQNIWPPDRFAAVAERLRDGYAIDSIMVRGPMDGEVADAALRAGISPCTVLSCPAPGFLGSLLRRAALTICNDTGVMHIAGAVGARCIAVFGPTDPARWKPIGDQIIAVRSHDGRTESVGVEEVFGAVRNLLDGSSGH